MKINSPYFGQNFIPYYGKDSKTPGVFAGKPIG